jgi:hypothetical protein
MKQTSHLKSSGRLRAGLIALVATAAVAAGGTAAWSAVNPTDDKRPQPTPTTHPADDKGGLRPSTSRTTEPGDDKGGLRPSTSRTTEPGDDKGGLRPSSSRTTEPGDDHGGRRGSGSGHGDDKGGHHGSNSGKGSDDHHSGKSSHDGPGHH